MSQFFGPKTVIQDICKPWRNVVFQIEFRFSYFYQAGPFRPKSSWAGPFRPEIFLSRACTLSWLTLNWVHCHDKESGEAWNGGEQIRHELGHYLAGIGNGMGWNRDPGPGMIKSQSIIWPWSRCRPAADPCYLVRPTNLPWANRVILEIKSQSSHTDENGGHNKDRTKFAKNRNFLREIFSKKKMCTNVNFCQYRSNWWEFFLRIIKGRVRKPEKFQWFLILVEFGS